MAISCVHIKKGLDIPLDGRPELTGQEVPSPRLLAFYPADFQFERARAPVEEGQKVRRGDILFYDRKNELLKFRSPVAGRVQSIAIGARRTIERIVIERGPEETDSHLRRFDPATVVRLTKEDVVQHLGDTGALALIEQRPFAIRAEPTASPKSIFVNGMNTAPFSVDIRVSARGEELAWQTGLDVLAQITPRRVFVCLDGRVSDYPTAIKQPRHADVFYFTGPHPSGLSSVHIHHLDPIRPGDTVWTLSASSVIQIGHAFLDGTLPASRVVSLGGPAVNETSRKHYRVALGSAVHDLLADKLVNGETRCIAGDALSGRTVVSGESIRLKDFSYTVLREGRERRYLGWIMPGLDQFSRSPSFLSWWFRRNSAWALDTNMHGSRRAMVLTGLYDSYMPMKIMCDFLIRAILAQDYEEAIKLGLLEVAPEDFALPAFVCPSKMDLVGIVRNGLRAARQEGF